MEMLAMIFLGTYGIWFCYAVGQLLHLLLGAHISIHSNLNSVTTYKSYFCYRWVPIVCRLFLTTMTFMIFWGNPTVLDLTKYMPTTSTQIAMAGILGWFSDSVFDKVLALIPMFKKELPAVDDPGPIQKQVMLAQEEKQK